MLKVPSDCNSCCSLHEEDEEKAESDPCSDNKSECEVQQHPDSDNKSEEAQQHPCSDNKSEREEVQQHADSEGSDNETESDGESDCPTDCEEEESDDDDDDSKNTRTFAQLVQPLSETERANLNNACNMPVHIHKVPGDNGRGKLQLQHKDLTLLLDADEMLKGDAIEATFRGLSHHRSNVTYIPETIKWQAKLSSGEKWSTLRKWSQSKAMLPFVQRLQSTQDEPPLGAEADYLLFPLNRQQPCKHWVLAALDLRTKQFTLLDSYARKDDGATLAKAENQTLQEYLDHLSEREHDKPIDWAGSLFPAEQPPQQYDLHDKKKRSGIDCGLICLFYAVALSYGGKLTISQKGCQCSVARRIVRPCLTSCGCGCARLESFTTIAEN